MRFGLTAATAVVGVAAGAYAVARLRVVAESCDPPRFYPALGQVAGAVTQLYVDSLSGTQIPQHGRYVLVDATSARLYMMEDGRVRNSMRVIVGKPASATPALSSVLNYATVNPYWNVSPDLAQKIIAPRVLKDGYSYLTERGYEVVSKFGADAQVLAPDKVDWEAVASGRMIVKVRQRPAPPIRWANSSSTCPGSRASTFMTRRTRELFAKEERNLSNGCVRLEGAPRLARWLLGSDPKPASAAPDQRVALPRAVPITISYLDSRTQLQLAVLVDGCEGVTRQSFCAQPRPCFTRRRGFWRGGRSPSVLDAPALQVCARSALDPAAALRPAACLQQEHRSSI